MAGESARSEYERIRSGRRERTRANMPLVLGVAALSALAAALVMHLSIGTWWVGAIIGPLLVGTLLLPSQREVAWRKGAEGERSVAKAMGRLTSTRGLHDRRMPGSRANIDHILVAPTGVWTIDAKNYTGRLETRNRGRELWVKGRNRSKLLEQARGQTLAVADVLAADGLATVPVRPVLCFLGVEWPLLFRPSSADDVALLSPRRLSRLLDGPPVLSESQIDRVAETLDRRLRPAVTTDRGSVPPPDSSSSPAPSPPRATPRATRVPDDDDDVTVAPWKRYGKDRLYVNARDGTTLGYLDLQTDEVVPTEGTDAQTVRDAAMRHLRTR